jgi:hypothetical protein
MNRLANFEHAGKRGFYRPSATVTFEQAVDMVAEGMRHARSLGLTEMVVNTHGLSGFAPPDVFARYSMVGRWTESGGASLCVAMVAKPEFIDPQKIGVIMAQNRGITADVFTTEVAAIAWLDGRSSAAATTP